MHQNVTTPRSQRPKQLGLTGRPPEYEASTVQPEINGHQSTLLRGLLGCAHYPSKTPWLSLSYGVASFMDRLLSDAPNVYNKAGRADRLRVVAAAFIITQGFLDLSVKMPMLRWMHIAQSARVHWSWIQQDMHKGLDILFYSAWTVQPASSNMPLPLMHAFCRHLLDSRLPSRTNGIAYASRGRLNMQMLQVEWKSVA